MAEAQIIANQKSILKNQKAILANQDTIKQTKIDLILKNQERMLALVQN